MNLLHCIYELAGYILLFDVDEFISFLSLFCDCNFHHSRTIRGNIFICCITVTLYERHDVSNHW